jgi:5'-nucleotidase (lipoprotein e(P4) family)
MISASLPHFCLCGLGFWLTFSNAIAQETAPAVVATADSPDKPSDAEVPAYRNLDAALYMHSSAEYHAICIQAYNWATERVETCMANRTDPRPAAVVLDLDETMLNNGAYQSWQIQQNYKFNEEKWKIWETSGVQYVVPVPGAQAFVAHLKSLNVQPVYITNRNERAEQQTLEILESLNMGVPKECLLCANEETRSSKTTRREQIASQYEIILLVGDNLRDFDEIFKYSPEDGVEGRKKLVDEHLDFWGKRWIVLPNPAYGEWTKPLGKGMQDTDYLMPPFPISKPNE